MTTIQQSYPRRLSIDILKYIQTTPFQDFRDYGHNCHNVLYSCLFVLNPRLSQNWTLRLVVGSLIQNSFPASFMYFTTLTFLQSLPQLFCRRSLSLSLYDVSLCLESGYAFLAWILHVWCYRPHVSQREAHKASTLCYSLRKVSSLVRTMLTRFLRILFFNYLSPKAEVGNLFLQRAR